MWFWEHFPLLSQNDSPRLFEQDKPRANKWSNLAVKNVQDSRAVFQSIDNFQWRPYSKMINNWRPPTYYRGDEQWICGNDATDEGVISFAQCIRSCELVGLDTIEVYLPERVAMQFGYDQDLLGCAQVNNRISDRELAWATYKKDAMGYMLYLPPQNFEPNVTYQYYSWWKEHAEAERERLMLESARKKQKLLLDLNATPLDLSDFPDGAAQNRQTNYANKEDNQSASEDEDSRDVRQEFNVIEHESFDYGECSNVIEDPENHNEKLHQTPK